MNKWWLFLDDVRDLGQYPCNYVALDHSKAMVARSSEKAIKLVSLYGLPTFMALDHDLRKNDTTMIFLHALAGLYDFGVTPPPDYAVHSANPVGTDNIHTFMKSWKAVYNAP